MSDNQGALGPIPESAIASEANADRIAILRAINRLLSGQVARKLTVKDLAEEAGVERHVLYQVHPDLREVWQRELTNSGAAAEPAVIVRLRDDLAASKALAAARRDRIAELEERVAIYAENLAIAIARVRQLESNLQTPPPADGIPRLPFRGDA